MASHRAYSDDASDRAYSDDFVSDDDRRAHMPYNKSRDRIRARGGHLPRGRGRGRGSKGGRGHSRNSEPINIKHSSDSVTKRVMSASRHKINNLRNQVEEIKLLTKDLEQENKLYKKMQYRQEKALKGFEDKEKDLPRILDNHNNEVRSLKEQNRRLRERFDKSDRYLRDAEDELERVKKKMNKYKEMCNQKDLAERDELNRKLTKAEIDMEEREVKIKELGRHVEILKKNHRHELGIEIARQKELKRQVDELTSKQIDVQNQLKEKDKELEYKNIYSNKLMRASSQENTSDRSPARHLKKRAPSLSELTPRDKAKFYEEKRRQETKKQKEMKAELEMKKRQKWEAAEAERLKGKGLDPSSISPSPSHRSLPSLEMNFSSIDKDLAEREGRARQREEEDFQRREEEKEKIKRLELHQKKKEFERREELRRKRELDDRERERRNRIEKERDNLSRKEIEERDKQEREREERERKEKLERERREKERIEQERRLQQERDRLENDPALQEERRKKNELLGKLQEMDKIGNNKPIQDSFVVLSAGQQSKENSSDYDTTGKRGDSKEYSFTRPVNNMHRGKPSHEDVTVPYIQRQRRRASKDDDGIVGYQPSFGPAHGEGGGLGSKTSTKPPSLFDDELTSAPKTTKAELKSSSLLENLFGSQAAKDSKMSERKGNDTFFITSNSPPANSSKKTTANGSSTFPWDMPPSPVKNSTSRSNIGNDNNRGSSTLIGGAAALIADDSTPNSNKVLQYRTRQQNINTFSAKPSVTAVDNFDDEIEEVVL